MSFEKSFLNIKKAYKKSKQSLNIVRIATISNDPMIIDGLLNDNISLSTTANWERLVNLDEILGKASKFVAAAGVNTLNTGQWTQKYYKGGSYLKLPIKFRIVDWDGVGNVVSQAKEILKWASPTPSFTFTEEKKIAKDSDGNPVVQKQTDKQKKDAEDSPLKTLAQGLWNAAGSIFNFGPPKVTIQISNFIRGGMIFIIDEAKTDFSKEMTAKGPLYVDVELTVSSFQIMDSNSIPLYTRSSGRVKYVNGTGIPTRLVK